MMNPLRQPITLESATLTIKVEGEGYAQERYSRDVASKLSKQGVRTRRYNGEELTLDLEGKTLSTCVALYKGLTAVQKAACRDEYNEAMVTFSFGGEAAGHDYAKLVKEPTPVEDHEIMRKVRNWSALSTAKILRALELMDLEPVPVKEGRKLKGFKITFPGQDTALYEVNYDTLNPSYRMDLDEDTKARYKAAKDFMIQAASDLLGLPNPNSRAGLPTRARDYRTDLTIRTCPCCFRDIKASSHTNGLIADHGFTIEGRGWSGWGGSRMGGCPGVGELPWEKSCEPAKKMISFLEDRNEKLVAYLAALESGEITEFKVDDRSQPYDRETRSYPQKVVTPADGYEFRQARQQALARTQGELRRVWSGSFSSLPWYRMAVRTWKPVADDQVAVGAPEGAPEGTDFIGKPDAAN